MVVAKKVVKTPTYVTYLVDCEAPVADGLMSAEDLRQFLHDRVKIDGKTGNFQKTNYQTGVTTRYCTISAQGNKIALEAKLPFNKRYVKFLTKKYLCRNQIRDFIRVVSTNKNELALKYYQPVKKSMEN
ncbi:60S ribosomal protein L22 [Gregarina niphandrodes]|uniref:Large ribosomal subunit protein eL22 n=1 Tax=Gregarina niphandrodes TaxID=110365 RepID=A0A023AYI1_GRENI|nr:60S ribosomal protein L22 [Gregarina niphandrodes]EZG43721.1 60S ribosomal protein L22 [Gregarina niphandrodes]|eukprot:XP_011133051.1 60S ribosomal protein L22 [Gregarina niphandrodes]